MGYSWHRILTRKNHVNTYKELKILITVYEFLQIGCYNLRGLGYWTLDQSFSQS